MNVGENWRTRRKPPETPQENAKNVHSQQPHFKNIWRVTYFNQSTYWHIVHKAIKCVGKLKKPERNHYGHYGKLPTDSDQGQLILTNLLLGVLIIKTWRWKRTGEPMGNLHRHHYK